MLELVGGRPRGKPLCWCRVVRFIAIGGLRCKASDWLRVSGGFEEHSSKPALLGPHCLGRRSAVGGVVGPGRSQGRSRAEFAQGLHRLMAAALSHRVRRPMLRRIESRGRVTSWRGLARDSASVRPGGFGQPDHDPPFLGRVRMGDPRLLSSASRPSSPTPIHFKRCKKSSSFFRGRCHRDLSGCSGRSPSITVLSLPVREGRKGEHPSRPSASFLFLTGLCPPKPCTKTSIKIVQSL